MKPNRLITRTLTAALMFLLVGIGLLPPLQALAQPSQVEVFDVKQGRVVKHIPNSPEIRQAAEQWVNAITGVVASANPEPKEGIIVGIPLNPPLQVSNAWMRDTVKVLFVFLNRTNTASPVLLMINDDNQPLLFQAKVDLNAFIDQYGLRELVQARSLEIVGQKGRLAGQMTLQLSNK